MKNWLNKVWRGVRWLIKELIATCSDEPSYFSKKRIQSWILFDSAIGCLLYWFIQHESELEIMQALEIYGALIVAAGYQVSTIQREKRFNKKSENKGFDKGEE